MRFPSRRVLKFAQGIKIVKGVVLHFAEASYR
jgi:hypothetical protein